MQTSRVYRGNCLLWCAVLLVLACCQNALADRSDVEAFVTRFYQQCLNREPDPTGLADWVDGLQTGRLTGADVANGFVFSNEFVDRNVDNDTYLNILYRAFFDRAPDSGGFSDWLTRLENGESRKSVLNGFLEAQEFYDLCGRYGIVPYNPVKAFVTRFYELCLDREPDLAGLADWVDGLQTGRLTGADVANGFVFSNEFTNRNTTDNEFLRILYAAFFNRDGDPGGSAYWMAQLRGLTPREEVLDGFIYAQEFTDLCNEYGIKAYEEHPFDGTWQGTAVSTTKDDYWGDPCGGATITMYITSSVVTGSAYDPYWKDWYNISGSVNGDGTISAGLAITSDEVAHFDGTLSGNSGGGNWTSEGGCRGTWSVSR